MTTCGYETNLFCASSLLPVSMWLFLYIPSYRTSVQLDSGSSEYWLDSSLVVILICFGEVLHTTFTYTATLMKLLMDFILQFTINPQKNVYLFTCAKSDNLTLLTFKVSYYDLVFKYILKLNVIFNIYLLRYSLHEKLFTINQLLNFIINLKLVLMSRTYVAC